jgi:hypothetical protein
MLNKQQYTPLEALSMEHKLKMFRGTVSETTCTTGLQQQLKQVLPQQSAYPLLAAFASSSATASSGFISSISFIGSQSAQPSAHAAGPDYCKCPSMPCPTVQTQLPSWHTCPHVCILCYGATVE